MATQDSTASQTADNDAADIAALAAELVSSADKRARETAAAHILATIRNVQREKAPQAPKLHPMQFAATPTLYALDPAATHDDVSAHLSARLGHLRALLRMTYGAGYTAFAEYGAETQENYLWACSSIADECAALLELLDVKPQAEPAAA
jgi:hypothetical protein